MIGRQDFTQIETQDRKRQQDENERVTWRNQEGERIDAEKTDQKCHADNRIEALDGAVAYPRQYRDIHAHGQRAPDLAEHPPFEQQIHRRQGDDDDSDPYRIHERDHNPECANGDEKRKDQQQPDDSCLLTLELSFPISSEIEFAMLSAAHLHLCSLLGEIDDGLTLSGALRRD